MYLFDMRSIFRPLRCIIASVYAIEPGNDYLFGTNLLITVDYWGGAHAPLVSVLAVGSRCRGSQPTAFYPQSVISLDGFNVGGGADVR